MEWFGLFIINYLAAIFCNLAFLSCFQKLYDQGARAFWIHNTGPLGCLAQNIAYFGKDPSKLDDNGCVSSHNRAAKLFNAQLYILCRKLRRLFPDANITYVDVFTIKLNLIANYSRYGKKLLYVVASITWMEVFYWNLECYLRNNYWLLDAEKLFEYFHLDFFEMGFYSNYDIKYRSIPAHSSIIGLICISWYYFAPTNGTK